MMTDLTWEAAVLTITILLAYEVALATQQKRHPERMAKSAHALIRREWFDAVSVVKGTEILAVQTVRNAVMAATMTSSISAIGLIGSATLAMPSIHIGLAQATISSSFGPRLLLELVLLALLFASLASSVMAVRFYNHAGFICAMPVDSEQRSRWSSVGSGYIDRAGRLYSWGVKHLILVAPILASILQPLAGPVAAALVVFALSGFDSFDHWTSTQ